MEDLRLYFRALQAIRHVPEAMAHGTFRLRARWRLPRGWSAGSILVVCHGNIYRSPFAERVLRQRLARAMLPGRVMSAGFIGPDRTCPPEAIAAAATLGIDLSDHRSRLLTQQDLDIASLIVVMEPLHSRLIARTYRVDRRKVLVLGDLDPEPVIRRGIRDPVEQPVAVLRGCYARIQRCVDALLQLNV